MAGRQCMGKCWEGARGVGGARGRGTQCVGGEQGEGMYGVCGERDTWSVGKGHRRLE